VRGLRVELTVLGSGGRRIGALADRVRERRNASLWKRSTPGAGAPVLSGHGDVCGDEGAAGGRALDP
jgi:hypothetical protein